MLPKSFSQVFFLTLKERESSLPRWEINGLSVGYKRAVDQNWGHMAKIGILDQKPKFWAQKKGFTF